MADKIIPNLPKTEATTFDDLLLVVDTPSESPTNKKISLANFFNKIPTWLGFSQSPATFTSGAIDVTTPISFVSVTGTKAYTLAAGSDGQLKILICTVAASTPVGVITPLASASDGYNTITFNAVGENATLIYSNSGWNVLSCSGSASQSQESMLT
jgi:hypothetical protein